MEITFKASQLKTESCSHIYLTPSNLYCRKYFSSPRQNITLTTAHSELRTGIKDWLFSYHLLQRKLNFIASPQLYAALNSYTSLMVGRGEVSLFSGIHSACVACVYNCVVRSSLKIFWITCAININSVGCAAHNTVVNTGNTGRMNAAEQTHLTSSNHYWGITIESCIELWGCNEIHFSLQEVIGK